jgi:resolvase-like protein/recombinase
MSVNNTVTCPAGSFRTTTLTPVTPQNGRCQALVPPQPAAAETLPLGSRRARGTQFEGLGGCQLCPGDLVGARPPGDFTALMAKAQKQSWALVALDCAVDTSTPAGEAMANMLATFAQFERRLISQRTREALAVKRAAGVRLGRPPTLPQAVVRRIQRQRARGDSLRAIADSLNRDEVATARGGVRWYSATVRQVLLRTS